MRSTSNDVIDATERALVHTRDTVELLFKLPERPSSRWHRAGMGQRTERIFDVVAGIVMAVFTIGWTWSISQARINATENGDIDAVTPVTASIDAALTDPDATSTAFLTDAALSFVTPAAGESGKLRAQFKQPGAQMTLSDTLPAGAQVTYRNGAAEESTKSAKPATPIRSGVWQVALQVGNAVTQVSDFSIITLTPFSAKQGGHIGLYYLGSWPGERGKRRRPGYTLPSGFIPVTVQNEDTWVSEHFQLKDFLPHDQSNVWPKYIVLEPREVDKLELVLADLKAHGINIDGVVVMSGFRTPQYNYHGGDTRGRAALSRHMYGDAADIFIDNDHDGVMDDLNHDGRINLGDARVIEQAVDRVERAHPALVGGCGVYPAEEGHGPFTHIDTRGFHARWLGAGVS